MLSPIHLDRQIIYRNTLANANEAGLGNKYKPGTITLGTSTGFSVNSGHQCFDFDGANTLINTGSDWIGTKAISISAWIYLDSYGETSSGRILANGKTLLLVSATNPHVDFYNNGSTNTPSANNSIGLSAWYHVAATRTAAGVANIYINGALSGTANQAGGTPVAGTENVVIGNNTAGAVTFDGKISDLIVWNRVLTASEVALLYKNGLYVDGIAKSQSQVLGSELLSDYFNGGGWGNAGNCDSYGAGTFTTSGNGGRVKVVLTQNARYRIRITGTHNAASGFSITDNSAGTSYINTVASGSISVDTTFTATSVGTGLYVRLFSAGTVTLSELSLMQITQESGSLLFDIDAAQGIIRDKTGLRTITNTAVTVVNDGGNYVMKTDGTTSKLDLGADFLGTTDLTIAGWIYATGWGEGASPDQRGRIISNNKLEVGINFQNNKSLWISSDGTISVGSAVNSLTLGAWYFVAATRTTNGTANLYIGTRDVAPALSGSANQASGTPVAGSTVYLLSNNGASTFVGLMRNLKSYNRILSLAELTQLWSSTKTLL